MSLIIVGIAAVLEGNSYFDKSLSKIGGVVNYGVCACDCSRGPLEVI